MVNEGVLEEDAKRAGLKFVEVFADVPDDTENREKIAEFKKTGTHFPCKIRMTKYGKIAITMYVPLNYMKKVLEG